MGSITKNKLLEYEQTNQIVFQFNDGLVTVTQPIKGYNESDREYGIVDEVTRMKQFLKTCINIQIISYEESGAYVDYFTDLIEWSQETDFFILVNDFLLLCIPLSKKGLLVA